MSTYSNSCRRLAVGVAFLAGLSTGLPVASAEYRASARFMREVRPGRNHPLADASGLLPLLVRLPSGVEARSRGLMPLSAAYGTARLAPDQAAAFIEANPDLAVSVWPGLRPLLDRSMVLNRTDVYRAMIAAQGPSSTLRGTGKGVVVGVLDTGIDVTHADFRDATGATRIAWLLDMTQGPLGLHPELETEFGCTPAQNQAPCAVLSAADIDRAIAARSSHLPRDIIGHGTHVASIAAGNGGLEAKYVGTAPEATLIVASVAQANGDLADPDIVTGARFVFDRAEHMPDGPMPAVVNLSLGGDFGPHNGSTPLEQALAGLVGPDHPGRAIIVAAGNSGGVYAGDLPTQALGVHTEVHVTAGAPASVPILSPGKSGDPDLNGSVYVWLTHRPGDNVSIGLLGPGEIRIRPIGRGNSTEYRDDKVSAFIVYGINDLARGTGLLESMDGAVVAWDGVWPAEGRFSLRLEGEGTVEMWLYGLGDAGITETSDGALFETATWEQTINVPATHPNLLAVGCSMNRLDWTDIGGVQLGISAAQFGSVDGACDFSSAGPTATGMAKPEISAPGGFVVAAMSRDASPLVQGSTSIFAAPPDVCPGTTQCFMADDTHAILSGSSMSAPQVAGAVALLLEKAPTLNQEQIIRLVQQGAHYPTGDAPLDYQFGAGALDVPGMIAASEATDGAVDKAVDATRSWVSLSASHMRPDADWPLIGTVQLRTSEGALADLDDPSRLQLRVTGPASIRQPPTRLGAGLYSFSIVADATGGQQDVVLDVTFDGKLLGQPLTRFSGHRIVPVAPDRWIAHGELQTTGGCAVAAAGVASKSVAVDDGLAVRNAGPAHPHRGATGVATSDASASGATGAGSARGDRPTTAGRLLLELGSVQSGAILMVAAMLMRIRRRRTAERVRP